MRTIFALGLTVFAGTALVAPVQAQPPGGGAGGPPNFMQFVDTDKDGKVSQAEYTAFAQARWGRISQGADTVKPADLQGFQASALAGITPAADGTVSKAAYEASIPAKFKAADTDGNGSLSEAELTASMPRRPAQ
ncbi:MAG: EF-hand domain-containing protein [Sphingobium sp.]|nr:EF-hand domain-containing protein [Sphingobium sp.]